MSPISAAMTAIRQTPIPFRAALKVLLPGSVRLPDGDQGQTGIFQGFQLVNGPSLPVYTFP
ncbi:MAG: hypothetical protein ACPL68_03640, partial [Candidatus Hydrothermia bacterium]